MNRSDMCLFFDIKRYSINDGPGIRTTLFMKGCPLSCVWCHNPEGISSRKQKMYTRKKCIGCNKCIQSCPNQALTQTSEGIDTVWNVCETCGVCADVCPAKAIEISGKEYTIDDLMHEIKKETIFMDQSGGGVTFCGGEPLMHSTLLFELIQRCKGLGIHCVVDTTLFARPEIVQKAIHCTDLFLVDLKLMDSSKHELYCGVPNELILSNIRKISDAGKEFVIRIPLIEGINADEENIRSSVDFISSLHTWQNKKVSLLPYHDIAKGKHEKLGTKYNPKCYTMSSPSEEKLNKISEAFKSIGAEVLIGG